MMFYLGNGVGGGSRVAEQISTGQIEPTHTLQFQDGENLDVQLVGQNSLYLFCVVKDRRELTIIPIGNQVRSPQKLP